MEAVVGRRQFFEISTKGALGLALARAVAFGGVAFMAAGCEFSISEILDWVNSVGPAAISSILELLVQAGIIACMTCSALANTVLAAITAVGTAITAYRNAAPADKATLLGKITTALQAALSAAQTFFESVSVPDASLADLIISIASLVLNAIAGFIGQLGSTVSTKKLKTQSREIDITPTVWKVSAFRTKFNTIVVQYNHPELVMR